MNKNYSFENKIREVEKHTEDQVISNSSDTGYLGKREAGV